MKSHLSISDDLEKVIEDNLNFYLLCLLLGVNKIFETLNIKSDGGDDINKIERVFSSVSLCYGT